MKNIGVFFYQGAGHLFINALKFLRYKTTEIHSSTVFEDLDGIILPGGESSVQYQYCVRNNIDEKIRNFHLKNKPILGTCAGAILLSRYRSRLVNGLGLIDIDMERNHYGRQISSGMQVDDHGNKICMIRAPGIISYEKSVYILNTLKDQPIFVRQGNVYCTTFHPELSPLNNLNPIKHIFG